MNDEEFDNLEFRHMSPTEFLGMTIEGAELVEDADGGIHELWLYAVHAESGERRVFHIYSEGSYSHWLDAVTATVGQAQEHGLSAENNGLQPDTMEPLYCGYVQ